MIDFLKQHETVGQDNWRVTETNEYGECEACLFPTLEEAKVFIRECIIEGVPAAGLELSFVVPFTVNVTIEV